MQTQQFWTKAYQKNINNMIGVCYRYVGDRQVAEDLAHQAFLTAIEKSATYRQLGSFEGWLMRINLNTTLMYLRKRPNFIPVDEADLADKVPVYEETLECKNRDFTQAEIMEAVAALPDRHRAVFNLFVFEKQKHTQIAEALNIGERSSKRYLAEARQQLQETLTKLQKNRKAHIMIILPLLFKKSYAIDTVCKTKLSGLSLAPLSASPLTSVNWAAVPKPSGWVALAAAQVPVTVGTTACAVCALTTAVVVADLNSKQSDNNQVTDTTVVEDTLSFELMAPTVESEIIVEQMAEVALENSSQPDSNITSALRTRHSTEEPATSTVKSLSANHKGWQIFQSHGFYGLRDAQGNVISYPKYSKIENFDEYKKGWALVEQFGYKGFIDSLGKEVVTPQYDEIGKFGQYRSKMALVSKGGLYGFINEKGEEIVPTEYSQTELIY